MPALCSRIKDRTCGLLAMRSTTLVIPVAAAALARARAIRSSRRPTSARFSAVVPARVRTSVDQRRRSSVGSKRAANPQGTRCALDASGQGAAPAPRELVHPLIHPIRAHSQGPDQNMSRRWGRQRRLVVASSGSLVTSRCNSWPAPSIARRVVPTTRRSTSRAALAGARVGRAPGAGGIHFGLQRILSGESAHPPDGGNLSRR